MNNQIGLSFIGLASNGLIPLISTQLPFLNNKEDVESFLLQFSIPIGMMLGQGDKYFTHKLFGSFPVTTDHNWSAYTYSFFVLDEVIDAPRGHQNMYVFALLFLKNISITNKSALESVFLDFSKKLKNIDELLNQESLKFFLNSLYTFFNQKTNNKPFQTTPYIKKDKKSSEIHKEELLKENTTIPSKIALPLLLHSVFHGYEQSTMEILGPIERTVDKKSELATLQLLEKFQFFDKLDTPVTNIQQSLELACSHLSEIGEQVNINHITENKLEVDITCQLADEVHPFLDEIEKCLWIRYITSILRKNLREDQEIVIHPSEFNTKGSKTVIEFIQKRRYKSIDETKKSNQ